MFIHSRETEEDSANEQQVRTALQSSMKPPSKHEKGVEKEKKTEMQGKAAVNRIQSRRARKLALQQDVDKLKRKLRHEENVHRALERAFTRPLGALPRLPPYLPSNTLELLAEVAVLEEEVVRLEEQVVNYRQGLYQEAVYLSSLKNTKEILSNLSSDKQNSNGIANSNGSIEGDPKEPALVQNGNVKKPVKKLNSEDRQREENQVNTNSSKNSKQSPVKKVHRTRRIDTQKISDDAELEEGSGPNKLSEDVLKCLMSIYFQMSSLMNSGTELESMPSVSGSFERSEERGFRDPYGICSEFGRREIGLYKYFFCIEAKSIDLNLTLGSSLLARRLKNLLQKLTLVDLSGLTHEQKLAFWINMYNSCMMNASLEHGIPATPEMVVTLMPKAMVNVSGHSLSAMTIEHFILRFPYRSKHTCTTRGVYGLDWPEPLVTFALSCGSWSSPAVRVYTESQVYKQLEIAKRDYLQAAIGISLPSKLAIPKLLDWYLLDFAKDTESLVDWICLQLPSQLRIDAVKCFETGRRSDRLQSIQVLSYEFKFRYILAP